ncbi:MAG: hypothetical protein EBZ69_08010, partial [Alphaproteobacteria bacterium]|nr:hypothetical protein [Alphaproteobacteria bacterium]
MVSDNASSNNVIGNGNGEDQGNNQSGPAHNTRSRGPHQLQGPAAGVGVQQGGAGEVPVSMLGGNQTGITPGSIPPATTPSAIGSQEGGSQGMQQQIEIQQGGGSTLNSQGIVGVPLGQQTLGFTAQLGAHPVVIPAARSDVPPPVPAAHVPQGQTAVAGAATNLPVFPQGHQTAVVPPVNTALLIQSILSCKALMLQMGLPVTWTPEEQQVIPPGLQALYQGVPMQQSQPVLGPVFANQPGAPLVQSMTAYQAPVTAPVVNRTTASSGAAVPVTSQIPTTPIGAQQLHAPIAQPQPAAEQPVPTHLTYAQARQTPLLQTAPTPSLTLPAHSFAAPGGTVKGSANTIVSVPYTQGMSKAKDTMKVEDRHEKFKGLPNTRPSWRDTAFTIQRVAAAMGLWGFLCGMWTYP